MSTLDATRAELALLVLYLNKAEARDKICRAIQYGSKFLSDGQPGTAQNVDKSTSLARKVFRLFKFVNDLHGLISPTPQGTPLPLILLGKSKNALLSTFLFLDQFVWLGRSGIYQNKERIELIGRISLFCWLGSSVFSTLVELGELGRLSASIKNIEKELKNSNKYDNDQYRAKLKTSNERTLALIKAGMDIVVAVGLLQLAPKKVTPRVTGAFGFITSLISCYQVGDSITNNKKFDQENEGKVNEETNPVERDDKDQEQHVDASRETTVGTIVETTEKSGYVQLPKESNEMKIRDEKCKINNDKDMETGVVNGNGTETGQIITTTIGGRDGQPKKKISYMAERVVGTGSFGVVYQAKCLETGEEVAIKKVLQDKRYKNRELQVMVMLDHTNVLKLKHCFYSTADKDELYLNLVLEYVPETVYRVSKHYIRMHQSMPILLVQLYIYQICRGLNYMHHVIGVCHRDIKPQNLLVNPQSHHLKICDFGSAKKLVPGEPNISYICSRYYRAPELIFGATEYTTAIDIWSVGCVLAELLLGQPMFPGESGVDQLVEIIKILGTPTREEIRCMNPNNYNEFKFPQIKAHPWHKVFRKRMPPEVVDLISRMLQYSPNLRCTALEACAHPFFDDLRDPKVSLPNGRAMPPLFDFTPQELADAPDELRQRLIPEHARS
ncbi:hypothetical protein TanjilG_25221 [Lupinus angustifolius]|uniref:non-specific serine/threonine protein kinase n=1 Tax=Lupinus angustifolius TaxID=3871 RepID=A0A1J7HFH1_LUPAN|nr:hypothetical protein TanjilG_25221 [Lupinus angustifolius]